MQTPEPPPGGPSQYHAALADLSAVFDQIDDAAVDALVDRLIAARRIVVFGAGRERLQIMGLAMRLFHLGMDVAVTGDMTTPPVGPGDALLATCGPGELSTATALMAVARQAGAEVLAITAQPDGVSLRSADFVLTLPAQTMADDQVGEPASILPMGSRYEGGLFILFEVMVLRLQDRLGRSAAEMRANHTNLE